MVKLERKNGKLSFIKDNITNKERKLYSGIRKGDIISCKFYKVENAEVIGYSFYDNIRITIITNENKKMSVVAKWCDIIKKVEDR